MASPAPNPSGIANVDHRGWKLEALWFQSFLGATEGWVCYVTAPRSSHKLNIGRWGSSDLAFEHGRAYVDRRVDAPAQRPATPSFQKRRS